MSYRMFKLKGAECWLFFVGGQAAHAAWLATPWDPVWGKASANLPNVEARVQAPLLQDGVVFERVDKWPHAVRVTQTLPTSTGVVVSLESLAVRDQPAGAIGAVTVEDDITSGSMPTAEPIWRSHSDVVTSTLRPVDAAARDPLVVVHDKADEKAAVALLHQAAKTPGLAQALATGGADVLETWQGVFFHKVGHVNAADIATAANLAAIQSAVKVATNNPCDYDGVCTAPDNGENVRGVLLVVDAQATKKSFRIGAILVAPPAVAVHEPAPSSVAADEALVALRTHESPMGTVRSVVSAGVGTKRLLVAEDERGAYLVEVDGAYSHVAWIWSRREGKSTLEARFDDVNGDGITDVVLFARWAKQDDKDPFAVHSEAVVVLRGPSVVSQPRRDRLGLEVDALGAVDLDDLVKRVHSPVVGALATSSEACSVLGKSATAAGLRVNATASGRIVAFDEPESPANASRIVPASRASDADAAMLKDACSSPAEGGFACRDGLCGNLGYGLGNLFRFVREGKQLKLETAMIYVGS